MHGTTDKSSWSLARFGSWLVTAKQDAVYAARSLQRAPDAAVAIAITLAVGIGATGAAFSVLDALFFRSPLDIVQPASVKRVWHTIRIGRERQTQYWPGYSYPQYKALLPAADSLATLAIYTAPATVSIEGVGDASESYASASFFDVLGIRPEIGRFYTAEEDEFSSPNSNVAVISDRLWRTNFQGSPAALGRPVTFQNEKFSIIGVAPPGFAGIDLSTADIWVPIASFPSFPSPNGPWWEGENVNWFQLVAREGSSVDDRQLEQRFTSALRLRPSRKQSDSSTAVALGPIQSARGPGKISDEARIATRLAVVAGLVLIIAAANVLNILLVRGMQRKRELAVRVALGMSRLRLASMLLVESLLLSICAGLLSILGAYWGGTIMRQLLFPDIHWNESALNLPVIAFAVGSSLVTGAIVGAVYAQQTGKADLTNDLRASSRGGGYRAALGGALIATQAGLSVVLLAAAFLFGRSVQNVTNLNIGFRPADQLTFVDVRKPSGASSGSFGSPLGQLVDRLRHLAGVERVAVSSPRPGAGFSFAEYQPDVDTTQHPKPLTAVARVSPSYFATTGIRILRGRSFAASATPRSEEVVINQALASALWPGVDPLGRCIRFGNDDACATVVGVAENAVVVHVLDKPWAQLYRPIPAFADSDVTAYSLVLRIRPGQTDAVGRSTIQIARALYPSATVRIVRMSDVLAPEYRPWKEGTILFALFGCIALLVAAIGIYASVSYEAVQRRYEIGVRIALGAQAKDVILHVLTWRLRAVTAGLTVGIVLSLVGGRLIAALLYGIKPGDPSVIVAVSILIMVVAEVAAFLPAWYASTTSPTMALRAE